MKKIIVTVLVLLCIFATISFCACDKEKNPDEPQQETKMAIDLRTPEEYELVFGESYRIVYRVAGTKNNNVKFTTQNDNVVTVDEYGNVKAVGVGESEVTLALVEDENVTAKVLFKVTKDFFYNQNNYRNGRFDLSTINDGYIEVLGDQTQLLVSEYSENWYFKCRLEHTGKYTYDDAGGRFGIGSFNVSKDVPIGHMMAWFGFIPKLHRRREYIPYVGGWRVVSTNQDPEIQLTENGAPMNLMEGGAVLELIRNGTKHYFTVTADGETYKYVYDCPAFEGIKTWPGIFSQNQLITAYEYEASSDMNVVNEKLNNFQRATEIEINGISDILIAGFEYDFKSTIGPSTTFDKSVSYELVQPKQGVTLTKEGKLTIDNSATGNVVVKAIANSNPNVTTQKEYNIIAKPQSTSTILDTGLIVGSGISVTTDNSLSITNGVNYIPFNTTSNKWMVSFNIDNLSGVGKLGFASGTNGFMQTEIFNILATDSADRKMELGLAGDKISTFAVANNSFAYNGMKVSLVKDGDNYYVLINDYLVKKAKLTLDKATIPAIYAENITATLSNIIMENNANTIDSIVSTFDKVVGGYLTKNGNSFNIIKKDFGNANDMNWPPVNDYENGIKSTKTFTSDFSISFKLSNIAPMLTNNEYDSKVLVYLRSERKTASVQFVIKGTASNPILSFCPNLNDETWIEYAMPENVNLLNGEHTIKVVRQASIVSVFIDGVRVFEDNVGLNAFTSFTSDMAFTPGIGTFKCGATISDVVFEEV